MQEISGFDVFNWLVYTDELKIPHGEFPEGPENWDQAWWDSYRWNPLQGSANTDVDPNASPKPTWDSLIVAVRGMEETGRDLHLYEVSTPWGFKDAIDRQRAEVKESIDVVVGGVGHHVGEGINHLTGLIQNGRTVQQRGDQATLCRHAQHESGKTLTSPAIPSEGFA